MVDRRIETYQEPRMEQILLPGAEVFTLTSVPDGSGEGVTPEERNVTSDWLQSW